MLRRAPRLADSLALILPSIPPDLLGRAGLSRLTSLASMLPPVHRAVFECPLAPGEHDVDLLQGILITDGEPDCLARFIRATEPLNHGWLAVLRLAQQWSADDRLRDGVTELWLEFDTAPRRPDITPGVNNVAPYVSAVLRRASPEQSLAIAQAFLEAILGQSGPGEISGALSRYARACPELAQISQIAVMPGGSTASMRVCVGGIPVPALDDYLVAIEWQGHRQQVLSLATILLDYADGLTLCLDVLHDRIVRVELECSFSDSHGLGLRQRPLLDLLSRLGNSAGDKADALARWPGTVTPLNAPGPWPNDLITQGLTRAENELGVLDRRLGNIKLSCEPGLPVRAKVRFGYGHVWTRSLVVAQRPARPLVRNPASTIAESVACAVDWLLQARHQSGWWRDFYGMRAVDSSDEWVTAYVGHAFARLALEPARTAAREALDLLLTRRDRASGWGFNVLLPPDGDATTWVLRLARSLAEPERERLVAGRRLLEQLTSPDGGVGSYTEAGSGAVDRIMGIGGSYDGYRAPHLCITAAAAVLGLGDRTLSYLRATQNTDGSWSSYWWQDDEYATAWAVEALASSTTHRSAVAAAVAWGTHRVSSDGAVRTEADGEPSAFATALALYAIRTTRAGDDSGPAAERALRWLLEHQLENGSWEPSARLRVPAPSVHHPWESPELIMHYNRDCGVWTTATVILALAASGSSRR